MISAPSPAPSPRCLILGTAGHIDHGKSALVKALTGTDPDRLPEEQARGMSIELGFARLDLPGLRFGIVDVPGHERFIRTMVSGATGIDLALFVVAADDGVMPQSREHAEILDLLLPRGDAGPQPPRGIIVINKADLVDAERIAAVRQQVAHLTRGTILCDWPHVALSATSGAGLDDLRRLLVQIGSQVPPRPAGTVFRLAIDRVFAVQGRGTVVTGSVLTGRVAPGAPLELHPGAIPCRVREVQSHGTPAGDLHAGQRAAVNLTGVDRERIRRGMELASPGYLAATRHLDARVRHLSRHDRPLPSYRRVRVCMGTTEHFATLVLLAVDARAPAESAPDAPDPPPRLLPPGDSALAQLRLHAPAVAAWGQRFILRDENAQATLGGGAVLRPVARRLTPRQADEIAALRALESDDPAVRLAEARRGAGFEPLRDEALACRAGVDPAEVARLRAAMRERGVLVLAAPGVEVHRQVLAALRERALAALSRHHANRPSEPGIPVERFIGWIERRAAAGVGRNLFDALHRGGEVVVRGPFVAHAAFSPALSPEDARLVEALVAELHAAGLDPPAWDKLRCVAGLPRPRVAKLLELARTDPRLVQIGPQHFAAAVAVERFKDAVRALGTDGRRFTLAQVRDRLGLSRRAVQPMLEYFDRIRLTRRIGDERTLL